ncbi:MAG: DUF4837 family protein [Catalinimonas sp.]
MRPPIILSLLLLFTTFACETTEEERKAVLPPALGNAGDVLFVADSALWAGPVGDELRELFQKPVPGVPTGEPVFFVQRVSPLDVNRFLRQRRNLIFVHTFDEAENRATRQLDNMLGEGVRTKAAGDTSYYSLFKDDLYARGQAVLYLFAPTEAQLAETIRRRGDDLLNRFENREIRGIQEVIYKDGENREATGKLRKQYGVRLRVPDGYEVAVEKPEFVWLRNIEAVLDRNLFVARQPYRSEAQFSRDSVLAWRDQIGRNYIFGSGTPDTTSFMMTEYYLPPFTKNTSFAGAYATEARGLWKLRNNRMGGVFVSYVVLDKAQENLYYLEGFVYAPNRDKRGYLRELEAILKTFAT